MWSEAELCFKANQHFCDRVREMSDGRLDIEAFSSGALMPYPEYFDAVRSGVVELCQAGGGYWSGKDPALMAIDNASVFIGDYPKMLTWMWEGGGIDLARKAYANWDLQYISNHMYTFAGESIISKVPVRTLDDIKGLKIRAPESLAPVWDALGADVLTIPGAEVYTALSTGLIEASDWGSPSMNYNMGYAEICPYYSKPGDYYMGGTGELTCNFENWNSLPDDLKAILEVAARDQAMKMWTLTSYDDLTCLSKLKEAGAEMVAWDPEVTKMIQGLIISENVKRSEKSDLAMEIIQHIEDYIAVTSA